MTCIATPRHKNPCPGGHEIYSFGTPSFVIIPLHLVCLNHAQNREDRNTSILHNLFQKYLFLGFGGVMKFRFVFFLILQMLHTMHRMTQQF